MLQLAVLEALNWPCKLEGSASALGNLVCLQYRGRRGFISVSGRLRRKQLVFLLFITVSLWPRRLSMIGLTLLPHRLIRLLFLGSRLYFGFERILRPTIKCCRWTTRMSSHLPTGFARHVVSIQQHSRNRRRPPCNTSRQVRTYHAYSSLLFSPPFLFAFNNQAYLAFVPARSIYPAIDPEPLYAARSYSGKVVLVTGASRGVGRETALQYARAGASVAIVARTEDALGETRDIIVAAVPGVDVLVLAADVRDVESVRGAVEGVLRHFGKLDILIANAGAITPFAPREDHPLILCFSCLLRDLLLLHPSAEQERP